MYIYIYIEKRIYIKLCIRFGIELDIVQNPNTVMQYNCTEKKRIKTYINSC